MSNLDTNIPVLTDIIPDSAKAPETAAPKDVAENPATDAPAEEVSNPQPEATGRPSYSEEDWTQLEHTLRENVLRQVLSRVDFVLEHRVRDSLADVLQTAVEKLTNDIRGGLHKTLEDVIIRAVSQEITKAKSQK
jgi:hypothetical protein